MDKKELKKRINDVYLESIIFENYVELSSVIGNEELIIMCKIETQIHKKSQNSLLILTNKHLITKNSKGSYVTYLLSDINPESINLSNNTLRLECNKEILLFKLLRSSVLPNDEFFPFFYKIVASESKNDGSREKILEEYIRVAKKQDKKQTKRTLLIIGFIIFIFIGVKMADKSDFIDNIDTHYQGVVTSFQQGNYEDVKTKLKTFEKYDKLDYKNIRTIQIDSKIAILEREVSYIPSDEIYKNLEIYTKLLELNPDSKKYSQKVSFYDKKVKAYETRKKAVMAKIGEEPVGDYHAKLFIKSIAKDPDSVEIISASDPKWDEEGWHQYVDYRARNGFGGMSVSHIYLIFRNGEVVYAR